MADATRDLYERYARQIYSYCLHQLGNREEAEDAMQSTFLNAFRGLKRGVDPEFESAWLYKIAQNVCLTRQRSSSRRRRVESPGDLDAMQDFVPAHQVDSDELIRLPEALDAMPEQQRRALLLREWQGLSYKEIGEELDLSQAAVETLLFRARRTLAAGLSEDLPPKGLKKRMRAGGDAGSLLALVKSLLLTGGAKVAATVATVAATSVVAASPAARQAVEDVVVPPHAHHGAKPQAIVKHAPVTKISGHVSSSLAPGGAVASMNVRAAKQAHRPLQGAQHKTVVAHTGIAAVGHTAPTLADPATSAATPAPTSDVPAPTTDGSAPVAPTAPATPTTHSDPPPAHSDPPASAQPTGTKTDSPTQPATQPTQQPASSGTTSGSSGGTTQADPSSSGSSSGSSTDSGAKVDSKQGTTFTPISGTPSTSVTDSPTTTPTTTTTTTTSAPPPPASSTSSGTTSDTSTSTSTSTSSGGKKTALPVYTPQAP
ncbi:MAG TPA: sigma-70 family RNA polymerase sigma factor [Gaiellaceae bacterium]